MIRGARALWRVGRGLRPLWVLLVFVWLVNGAVTLATDAAWFASHGRLAMWKQSLAWSLGLQSAFALPALLLCIATMRTLARPAGENLAEPPLPRALRSWQNARRRVASNGWTVLLVSLSLIGHALGARWSDFAIAFAHHGTFGNANADFWVWRAPALYDALNAAWTFTLLLGAVALAGGVLRALPFLAARQSLVPTRWLALLVRLGIALLLLRALGFGLEFARHASQSPFASEWGRAGAALLDAVGVLGCLGCTLALRHARPTLILWVALFLGLVPLASISWTWLAGRSAPELEAHGFNASLIGAARAADVPSWDDASLGRALRTHLDWTNRHLTEWQSAALDASARQAQVVGQEPETSASLGAGGPLAWQTLDVATLRPTRSQPLGPFGFGLDAKPTFSSDARAGVPLDSWMWKMAWAWRLREPILLLEGAREKRLLVWRGARESAERLAPFWTWDDAVPRRDARTGAAFWEVVAYATTANFPRAGEWHEGVLSGENAARPVAVLRQSARNGSLTLAPFSDSAPWTQRWTSALGRLWDERATVAPTPALEVARANSTPLVWLHSDEGWQRRAIPLALRDKVVEKLNELDRLGRVQASTAEGATPVLWREGDATHLARPFFFLGHTAPGTPDTDGQSVSRALFAGWAHTTLASSDANWTSSLDAPEHAPPSLTPPKSQTKAVNTGEAARQAIAAQQAALRAWQGGRYSQAQELLQQARQWLEPLTR